jgi:hypothetical protein
MQTFERTVLYQRRGFSDVLNDAFYFLSQNFFPLSKLILLYAGPVIIIESYFGALFQIEFMNPVDIYALLSYGGIYLFLVAISSALIIGITCHYLALYNRTGVRPVDLKAVMEAVGKNVIRLFFALVMAMVIFILSLFLFIIPGIYLMVVLSLVWMIMIQEERGFFSSLERSWHLIRGHWWRTLGLIIISWLIQSAIGFILQAPAQVINFLHSFHQVTGKVSQIPAYMIMVGLYLNGLNQFFLIITVLIIAFQYYSIREKKEAPDLLARIEAIKTEGDVIA